MTKSEFEVAAYLAVLPEVTRRILKENYPAQMDHQLAESIASIASHIADASCKEMQEHIAKNLKGGGEVDFV